MAYFAWVKNQQAWMPIAATPQIIHDEEMANFITGQGHLVIIKKHPLTEAETQLPFGQLVKRYPLEK